jgi:GLPGLI family protein
MIRNTFLIFIIVFSTTICFCQQQSTCYVLYREILDPSWSYPHWFGEDKLTYTSEIEYSLKDFPVILPDGKIIHTSDTVTYKKQYLDFKIELNSKADKGKDPISVREYTSNILRRHSYISDKKYLVVDTIANMSDWTILDNTTTILGFTCQKATTLYKGKKYTAYFCTGLPFSVGPRNYRGLPGLILRIVNETGNAGYEAIEVQYPFKGKVPVLETDGTIVSQNQYQVLVDESNIKRMKMMGNFMQNPTIKRN